MTKFGYDEPHDDGGVQSPVQQTPPELFGPLSVGPANSSNEPFRVPRYIALIILVSQVVVFSWIGRGPVFQSIAVFPARPPTGRVDARLLFAENTTMERQAEIMPGAALFQGLQGDKPIDQKRSEESDAVPEFQVDLRNTVRMQVASGTVSSPTVSSSVPQVEDSPRSQQVRPTSPANKRSTPSSATASIGGYKAEATFYYPDDDPLQGGYVDRETRGLRTVQDYIKGKADYISVAIDVKADMMKRFPYGTEISIPTLEAFYRKKYGLPQNFQFKWKLVDTGEAFFHRGTRRLDICVEDWDKAYNEGGRRSITWSVKRLASDDPV